ncbi:MAG TPA: hypothetical protein VGH33_26660 [Isosphaeraceae bacterium]
MSEPGNSTAQAGPDVAHCVARIGQIVAGDRQDRRAILQLGYNLGRLSELTRLGRGPFWDAWKDAVADWDRVRLSALARDLHVQIGGRLSEAGGSPFEAEPTPP